MGRDTNENSQREKSVGLGLKGAIDLLTHAHALGVRTVILCPGGRNAPMTQALELISKNWGLEVLHFFEERSAAFFALGRAKRDQRPVLISVTSGTAAAELLPATIEAHASAVPLLLVTADRPRSHRGSGSPQSMWQTGMFGPYATTLVDWEEGEAFPDFTGKWDRRSPVHLNLCHFEPLWSPELPALSQSPMSLSERPSLPAITAPFPRLRKPLVLLGALPQQERLPVAAFLRWYGAPILAEASSGLREDASLPLIHSEKIARRWWKQGAFDGVLRFGGVPSWRLWRDLEDWSGEVHNFGPSLWSGLPGRSIFTGELTAWLTQWREQSSPIKIRSELIQEDTAYRKKRETLYQEFPRSEPALIRKLSHHASDGAMVYLGNSRPIRDWNEHALISKTFEIQENRGMNGIDGQVSSFLGHCRDGEENWALLGDLTTMYDLAGPWALRHLSVNARMNLVIMNNQGGRIFERIFPTANFLNEHDISFAPWAKLWNLPHQHDFKNLPKRVVIELQPDTAQTRQFREAADQV